MAASHHNQNIHLEWLPKAATTFISVTNYGGY
jgi:hypothetical protein